MTYRDDSNRLATEYTIATGTPQRTKDYFYFGNLLVATKDFGGVMRYYSSDHLGTPRLVTDANGGVQEKHNYLPYGQEVSPGSSYQPLKFASMERDASSNNDYDHARFHFTGIGRFLSVDRHTANASQPKSWNKYVYCSDNPLTKLDPDGLFEFPAISVYLAPAGQAFHSGLEHLKHSAFIHPYKVLWSTPRLAFPASNPIINIGAVAKVQVNSEDASTHVKVEAAATVGSIGPKTEGDFQITKGLTLSPEFSHDSGVQADKIDVMMKGDVSADVSGAAGGQSSV